jgi:hypothetical protein
MKAFVAFQDNSAIEGETRDKKGKAIRRAKQKAKATRAR